MDRRLYPYKGWVAAGSCAAVTAIVAFSGCPAAAQDVSEINEALPFSESIPTKFVGPEENKDDDKDIIPLLPRINDRAPSKVIEGLDSSGQIFLPFDELMDIFWFAVTIDPVEQKANGFFISPDNEFFLDITKRTIRIGKESYKFTRNDIRTRNGKIYISPESFTTWFGINSVIDRGISVAHFTTDKKLPQDIWEERHKKWQLLSSINESCCRLGQSNLGLNKLAVEEKTALLRSDTAGFAQDGLEAGNLLQLERLPRVLDFRTFKGRTGPGYDVELYHGGNLISFQTADDNGGYFFDNIPVLMGDNAFRFVFYGPQGQVEESFDSIAASGMFVKRSVEPFLPAQDAMTDDTLIAPYAQDGLLTTATAKEPDKEERGPPALTLGLGPPIDRASMAVSIKNWSEFSVTQDRQARGSVEAYVNLRGTFLRLDSLLSKIGISFSRQNSADAININLKNGKVISLNVGEKEYTENGQTHSLYDNDAFVNDEKIFVNVTLLNRLLPPFEFVEDLAQKNIVVAESGGGIFGLPSDSDKSDVAPAPLAAPVQPVIIDDLSGQQRVSGAAPAAGDRHAEEAQDVLRLNDTVLPSLPSPTASEQEVAEKGGLVSLPEKSPPLTIQTADQGAETKETVREDGEKGEGATDQHDDMLILQPRIKNQPPQNEFIEAIDHGEQVFLPLNDIVQILEFPIKIDPSNNGAKGFFISSDNEFELDIEKRTVRVGQEQWTITRNDVRRRDNQIYISSDSFAKWFGITCSIDRSKAMAHFTTDKKLPQEEREERQKRWQKMLDVVENKHNDLPLLLNDYKVLGYPAIDVNIGAGYAHSSSASSSESNVDPLTSSYNVQGSMDLAYLTSQFYAQGDRIKPLTTLRLQAGRKDPSGNLLGGLQATEFSIGDVTSPSLTLVTTNSLGRGFALSNRALTSSENFDFRNFSGDSVPGYEVELYRNNVLVAFQTVDSSGRYNFENIPILYGENVFRIVFYGGQGQREEKIETVSASSALLKENQFVYTLGVSQRGKEFLPFTKKNANNPNAPPGLEAVGGFRYGLTRNVSAGAAVAETNLEDGIHRYLTATAGANIEGLLMEANVAKDATNGGMAQSLSALGGFEGVSLRARYRYFSNFASESINNSGNPLSSDASFDANTQLHLPIIGNYSFGLSALRETFSDTSFVPRYTYSWRSSKSLWGLSFTNAVDYIIDEEKRFQNTLGVQTRLWGVDLRAIGVYDYKPIKQFRDASVMASYYINDRLSGQTQIDKNLTGESRTVLGQSINWDFDSFRVSFNGQMDNDKQFTVGMNILFSVNHDAASNRWLTQPQQTSSGGAVSGRVYVDENYNNQLDDGEKIVSDAKVKINKAAAKLSPEGYFVSPVAPYEVARVELDASSISDPLLTSAARGYQVMTRPGDVVVADFPLVHTTIIDGSVIFLDETGAQRELNDVVVQLEDMEGKPLRRVLSAIDGYFSFDKIQPGEYRLTVPEEALTDINAALDNKVSIKIAEVSEFITGQDIILRQKEKLNGPPVFSDLPSSSPSVQGKESDTQKDTKESPPLTGSFTQDPSSSLAQPPENKKNNASPEAMPPEGKGTDAPANTDSVIISSRDAFIKKTLSHYAPVSWPALEELARKRFSERQENDLSREAYVSTDVLKRTRAVI